MRPISLSKYIAAFAMTLLIFISGMWIGQLMAENNISEQTNAQNKARLNLLGLDIQSNIIQKNLCEANIFSLTNDRFKIGQNVEKLEQILGKDSIEVVSLKEEYTLLSINQWLLIDKYKKECDNTLNTILYFYSNIQNEDASEDQGYVLDYIFRNNNESVVIYAIDYEIANVAVETLKGIYNVSSIPTLIINEEKFEGLQNREDIERVLIK